MLEILSKIASLFTEALVHFQGQKDRSRKRDFGRAAVTCYLRLLEVIAAAQAIVGETEFFVRRFEEHLVRKDDWEYFRSELRSTLEKQALNLMRLGWALKPIHEEMLILAPDLAVEIESLVEHKGNIISGLARYCKGGQLPLDVQVEVAHSERFGVDLKAELIDTAPVWDEAIYNRLRMYLADGSPRGRIEQLRENATKLRALLVESFTLEEILWSTDKFRDETGYLF